jgi:hypothetical protein
MISTYAVICQLIITRKRKRESNNMSYADSSDLLPDILAKPLSALDEESFEEYFKTLTKYNNATLKQAFSCISNITPGLKHCSIHCVSFTDNFPRLIGFNIIQFSRLFMTLRSELERLFPRNPEIIEETENYRRNSQYWKT